MPVNSTAPTPNESNSISSQRLNCASALTRWLKALPDFREAYEELRAAVQGLPIRNLPEFEEDKQTPELLTQIERALLAMLENAPSSLLPKSFGAGTRPGWEREMFEALRRENLPATTLESDSYGPEK